MDNSLRNRSVDKQRMRTFDFVDVNPGLSGLHFAAEAEGGECVGVLAIKPLEIAAFEAFHGRGSAAGPEEPCDLVLTCLPFSLFARGKGCDPAVSDLVKVARQVKGAVASLFCVPWKKAFALGVSVDDFVSAVEAHYAADRWHVSSAVTDGHDALYICAVDRKKWNGRDTLPSIWPKTLVPANGNPQEMMAAFGYPANFALQSGATAHKIEAGIVVVHNARAAVAGVVGAIGE